MKTTKKQTDTDSSVKVYYPTVGAFICRCMALYKIQGRRIVGEDFMIPLHMSPRTFTGVKRGLFSKPFITTE